MYIMNTGQQPRCCVRRYNAASAAPVASPVGINRRANWSYLSKYSTRRMMIATTIRISEYYNIALIMCIIHNILYALQQLLYIGAILYTLTFLLQSELSTIVFITITFTANIYYIVWPRLTLSPTTS